MIAHIGKDYTKARECFASCKKWPWIVLGLLISSPIAAQEKWEWTPVIDARLLGGQFFFEGQSSSFGGYADLDIAPMVRFSPTRSLLLHYSGRYRGFKQVNELVGGGTLFQQYMTHQVVLKPIQKLGENYELKPRISYKKEFFRETNDEQWGKGLYDYDRIGTGIELKKRKSEEKPHSWYLSYDVFDTSYPNYVSLASKGKELSAPDPGTKILDYRTHQIALGAGWDLKFPLSLWSAYAFNLISFKDQKVIDENANYISTLRGDQSHFLEIGGSYKFSPVEIGGSAGKMEPYFSLNYTLNLLISNQNHFDTNPSRLKFIPNYYSYLEHGVSPSLSVSFSPIPISLNFSYGLKTRNYSERLTQNAKGIYEENKINQVTHAITFGGAYKLTKRLSLEFIYSFLVATSNMKFEQTYRYNYNSSNYFIGLAFQL